MTRNNLTTDGSEFVTPDGKPYTGSYHVHISEGAMVGPTHTNQPHKRLSSVNEVVASKVAIIQRGMRNEAPAQPQPQPARRASTPARQVARPASARSNSGGAY